MKQNTTLLIFLALILTLGLSSCSTEERKASAAPETVRNVPVIVLQRATVPDLIEATGTVRAALTSELAGQVTGNLVEVRVREGDRVQRGQILAVIDDAQARAAVDRASAANSASLQQALAADSEASLSESTLNRYQSLYEKRSVSPQEFDEIRARNQAAVARRDMARADVEGAKAALAQARTSFEYTRIRAPFNSVVIERKLDPGALAAPGMPILVVEDPSRYRLEATVNETDLRHVRLGQQVSVAIDALGGSRIDGKVAQVVPAADAASRTFLIKVELPRESRLRSGLFGRAQFPRGEKSSLLIPQTAVVTRGQLQGVYVLGKDNLASLRYATMGKSFADRVEVLAGLQEGDRVVVRPGDLELSGKRIEAGQ